MACHRKSFTKASLSLRFNKAFGGQRFRCLSSWSNGSLASVRCYSQEGPAVDPRFVLNKFWFEFKFADLVHALGDI